MFKKESATLLGQKLFLIIAHPDDEGFLAAGLLWQNHRAGGRNIIACATLGEKGIAHLKKPMSQPKLKTLRRKEMRSVTKFVGVDRIHELGLRDGRVKQDAAKLLRLCRGLIKRDKPDVLLSFGPDGYTGHRDHVACWKVASQLAKESKLPQYAFTVPPKIAKQMPGWLSKQRFNPHYQVFKPFLQATQKIATPEGLKLKVLRRYGSQVNRQRPYNHLPKSAVQLMTAAEYFARIR